MAETVQQNTAPQQQDALIVVTEAAANKMKAVLAGSANTGIRVAVAGGGCAGLQYDLAPAEAPAPNDIIHEAHGLSLFINPMVVPYLKGTQIDYSDSMMEGGFKFSNPNAASSCGCGTSFSV